MRRLGCYALALVLLAPGTGLGADARTEYYQRAVARDMSLFNSLDRDQDHTLTRLEVQGDLDLGPRFNDMDINRDGVVTLEELQRYVQQWYGAQATAGQK